jgi:hypothetical protein
VFTAIATLSNQEANRSICREERISMPDIFLDLG